MSSLLRSGLSHCLQNVPRPVKLWPYRALLGVLRRLIQDHRVELWPRNSLALGYWEFATSDIDLSVWVEGDFKEAEQVWEEIKPWRLLLLGGEVQIYSSRCIAEFLPYANAFELRRDPRLLERLELTPAEVPTQKAVFLLRMLLSDKTLRVNPNGHHRKWAQHLKAAGLPESPCDLYTVAQHLAGMAQFPINDAQELLETIDQGLGAEPRLSAPLPKLLYCNHHPWMDMQAEDRALLSGLSDAGHAFLAGMVEWEVWGLSPLTLTIHGLPAQGFLDHLRNQMRLVEELRVTPQRKEFLLNGFRALARFYDLELLSHVLSSETSSGNTLRESTPLRSS